MMNNTKIWAIATLCVSALTTPLVYAQAKAMNDAPPPPQLEKLEEGEAPTITIRKQREEAAAITQTRQQNEVKETKVRSGSSTYRVQNHPVNTESSTGRGVQGAQWTIKEFDWSGDKKKKKIENSKETPQPPADPAAQTAH